MHINVQIRKGKRIYSKANVASWTPKPGHAALLNVRFSHFSNTHSRVSAGWPDAQRSRHNEGARELQLQCRCSLPYFIFTAQRQSTQAGTNTYMQTRVSAERLNSDTGIKCGFKV